MGAVPTAAAMDLALQPSVWTEGWRFHQQTYGVHASWNFKNQSEKCEVAYLFLEGYSLKNFFSAPVRDSLTVQHEAGNKFDFTQKALSDAENNYT